MDVSRLEPQNKTNFDGNMQKANKIKNKEIQNDIETSIEKDILQQLDHVKSYFIGASNIMWMETSKHEPTNLNNIGDVLKRDQQLQLFKKICIDVETIL